MTRGRFAISGSSFAPDEVRAVPGTSAMCHSACNFDPLSGGRRANIDRLGRENRRGPIGRKVLFGNVLHSESRMSTRADDYRQRALAADRRAAQTSDPHIRGAYERITGDWLALATRSSQPCLQTQPNEDSCALRHGFFVVLGRRVLVLAGLFVWRFLRTGGPEMLRMMNRPAETSPASR